MTHVYYLDVSLPGYSDAEKKAVLNAVVPRLAKVRQEKVLRTRFLEDQLCSAGAGLLLDIGLQQLYGLHSRELTIAYEGNQKPYLEEAPQVHFNLSHSGTMVMAAFSGYPIGCDIERIGKMDDRIVKRFYHPEEQKRLSLLDAETQRQEKISLFFRYWTLKESVLKVTGEGMRLPMNSFYIDLDEPVSAAMESGTNDYRFLEHPLIGYCSSVCVDGDPGEVFFSFQNLQDVV